MANNSSFAIELQDIDIPAEAKTRIDQALQKTVMTELAKLDLAAGTQIEPISDERAALPWTLPGGVMGFILRNPISTIPTAPAVDRSTAPSGRHVPLPPVLGSGLPLPLTDTAAFQAVCMRPDIRQAIISNSQALMELLSDDEHASKNFNILIGKLNSGQATEERLAPLIIAGICVGAAALGGAVGWWSRP